MARGEISPTGYEGPSGAGETTKKHLPGVGEGKRQSKTAPTYLVTSSLYTMHGDWYKIKRWVGGGPHFWSMVPASPAANGPVLVGLVGIEPTTQLLF